MNNPKYISKIILAVCFFANIKIYCQNSDLEPKNRINYQVKLSFYSFLEGGTTFSLGVGTWAKFKCLQPSSNISLNAVLGRNNLGNRNRPGAGNDYQINLIFSPLLTFGNSNKIGVHEYINPFYLGNSGAVLSNHRSSITIGTNFITLPRGSRYNSSTSRNRTQQLMFVQAKLGFDSTKNIIINFYDDFAGISSWGILKGLADNFDRFYTGGGNIQFRFNENLSIKAYFEIYTGTFHKDLFDFPDFITEKEDKCKRKLFRITSQEPGQKLFNRGRSIINFSYKPKKGLPEYNFYIGAQDGGFNMFFQNVFHDGTKLLRPIQNDSIILYKKKLFNGDNSKLVSLHRFFPNFERGHLMVGVGANY